jgi:hypothetical protein
LDMIVNLVYSCILKWVITVLSLKHCFLLCPTLGLAVLKIRNKSKEQQVTIKVEVEGIEQQKNRHGHNSIPNAINSLSSLSEH